MRLRHLSSFALALSLLAPVAHAADGETSVTVHAATELEGSASSGEKIYRRNCRACHGSNGKGASSYPKLVDHPAAYLIDRIVRYRAGETFGPNTPLMAQRVNKLSDQDIANVTAFILTLNDG